MLPPTLRTKVRCCWTGSALRGPRGCASQLPRKGQSSGRRHNAPVVNAALGRCAPCGRRLLMDHSRTHSCLDIDPSVSQCSHTRIRVAGCRHSFFYITTSHSLLFTAMARPRRKSKRRERRAAKGKAPATPPPEDVADFSYLVEEGSLMPGTEHEAFHLFVTCLIADATSCAEEFKTFQYLKTTRGSPGQDLCRLTHEITYFKQEMDKIDRESSTLDLGPKEYAILEVVVCESMRGRRACLLNSHEAQDCSRSLRHPFQIK